MITAVSINTSTLCRRIVHDWTEQDLLALESELSPYIDAMRRHFGLRRPVQSHLQGTASLCTPITPITA